MNTAKQNSALGLLPKAMLLKFYQDQQKILKTWGIPLPDEDELFEAGCPLWVKVQFYDWIIREGVEF